MDNKLLLKLMASAIAVGSSVQLQAQNTLLGRAVLPAQTYSTGPTSGKYAVNTTTGIALPFVDKQPVQGFSGLLKNNDGTYTGLADNGYGGIENSADFYLRIYHIRPTFKTVGGGSGNVEVLGFIELNDKDNHIPFTITNEFTTERKLTGADFDPESIVRAPDSSFWIGDEFGPFLLHFDKMGKLLEAPYTLPDFDNSGKEIRSPQNPFNEETAAIRIMNAVRAHAMVNGNMKAPVFSPDHTLIDDADTANWVTSSRKTGPSGSGLTKTLSEIFNVTSIKNAGYPVVAWTVNDSARMVKLMQLGVNGIISDDPSLLWKVASKYDGPDADTKPDFIDSTTGLLDIQKFDAQGHRGGRNLRPENTLPAMEVALDYYMTTLELDNGITKDSVPVLGHDPYIFHLNARKRNGAIYTDTNEVLIRNLTLAEIQGMFIGDKKRTDRPAQLNDTTLSPVAVAFTKSKGLPTYVIPSLENVFDFVQFYVEYYTSGAGASHPDAVKRRTNASKVRFNIETKMNPRTDVDAKGNVFLNRTIDADNFAIKVANVLVAKGMTERADIQSFAFQTLRKVQMAYPQIRTVYLFTDGPLYKNANNQIINEGTNLQPQGGNDSPWLMGMYWPYRMTRMTHPFRAAQSGGYEGMAITTDKTKLLPLLERPLTNGTANTLLIHEFDLATKSYNGTRYNYALDAKGTNIGDFIMYNANNGLVIERDGSQGNMNGFKKVFRVTLSGNTANKKEVVDLLNIRDTADLTAGGPSGDVGLGRRFGMPFQTIESVWVYDSSTIGIMNDNNYPFSVGRHVGDPTTNADNLPDDNEIIMIGLDASNNLGNLITDLEEERNIPAANSSLINFPNPFASSTTLLFSLAQENAVSIAVVNTMGEEVKKVDLGKLGVGFHSFLWDGQALKTGVYTIKMKAGNKESHIRVIKTE